MRLEVVEVSPTLAREWIDRSVDQPQRKLNLTRVDALSGAIRRGQWMLTHQAIALDPAGVVIDGQHRLHAIEKSGQTVTALVAFDADPTTFQVIDLRGTRLTRDSLHIAGYSQTAQLSAAARLLLLAGGHIGTKNLIDSKDRSSVTTTDVLDLLESDRGTLLMSKTNACGQIAASVRRPGVRASMQAALTLIDESGAHPDLQEEFTGKLESGSMLADTSPILALRRWLGGASYDAISPQNRPQATIMATAVAWNHWMNGRTVSFIKAVPGLTVWQPFQKNSADEIRLDELERESA